MTKKSKEDSKLEWRKYLIDITRQCERKYDYLIDKLNLKRSELKNDFF